MVNPYAESAKPKKDQSYNPQHTCLYHEPWLFGAPLSSMPISVVKSHSFRSLAQSISFWCESAGQLGVLAVVVGRKMYLEIEKGM